MSKVSHVYVTFIRATPEKVWRAITDPDLSGRYWGHSNVSDWTVGAAWEHRRIDASKKVDLIGTVLESEAPRRLVITWAFPGDVEEPAKVSRVAFDIDAHKDDVVRLTVSHTDLEPGGEMERGITQGWPIVLSSLKSFLETGKGLI
jgi:uncharacterized protein YndB with AHSA1/START domain